MTIQADADGILPHWGELQLFRPFSIVLLLTLTAAVATLLLRQDLQPEATIHVGHPADLDVAAVEVTVFSCGTSQLLRKEAEARERVRSADTLYDFSVKLCGEGSHEARLILADGRVLFGPGNSYIESGSSITDTGPFTSTPPESRWTWPH